MEPPLTKVKKNTNYLSENQIFRYWTLQQINSLLITEVKRQEVY